MTQKVLDGILKSGLSHHQGGSAASVHLYTPALYRCTVQVLYIGRYRGGRYHRSSAGHLKEWSTHLPIYS